MALLGGMRINMVLAGDQPGQDPELAYGVSFATAASQTFGQPFLWERNAFQDSFPDGEAKRLGIQWGRQIGIAINKMRTADGSEPQA